MKDVRRVLTAAEPGRMAKVPGQPTRSQGEGIEDQGRKLQAPDARNHPGEGIE